jgi:hypothetical protein
MLGNLDKSPSPLKASVILTELHDILADGSTELVRLDAMPGIEIRDVPSVDRRVVLSQRGTVHVPRLGALAVAAQPADRKDPYVLNCLTIEHPAEMPFTLGMVRFPGQWIEVDIKLPGANKPAVEI